MDVWPRAERTAGWIVVLALCFGLAGPGVGQEAKPPSTYKGPPGGTVPIVQLPDLVILKFHFAAVLCKLPGDQPPGYRGWFELKNQGTAPAVPPETTDRMVSVYWGGQGDLVGPLPQQGAHRPGPSLGIGSLHPAAERRAALPDDCPRRSRWCDHGTCREQQPAHVRDHAGRPGQLPRVTAAARRPEGAAAQALARRRRESSAPEPGRPRRDDPSRRRRLPPAADGRRSASRTEPRTAGSAESTPSRDSGAEWLPRSPGAGPSR